MKRKFLLMAVCAVALAAQAQQPQEDQRLANIDWQEDSIEVQSVDDIIKEQQAVTQRNTVDKHYGRVWGYRSYVNFTYHTKATLTPDETLPTGLGFNVPEMTVEYGGALQVGRTYRLHKKAIANTVQLGIDYTGIDLNVNYFKAVPDRNPLYLNTKSHENPKKTSEMVYYLPWCMEKFEANYGMRIGPSITLAPLTYVNSLGANFFKIHAYYHFGYHVSGVYMKYDDDLATSTSTTGAAGSDSTSDDGIAWGHGQTRTYGLNLSWKFIGVGFEHRTGELKYRPISGDYGNYDRKFKTAANRVYLQIRW